MSPNNFIQIYKCIENAQYLLMVYIRVFMQLHMHPHTFLTLLWRPNNTKHLVFDTHNFGVSEQLCAAMVFHVASLASSSMFQIDPHQLFEMFSIKIIIL